MQGSSAKRCYAALVALVALVACGAPAPQPTRVAPAVAAAPATSAAPSELTPSPMDAEPSPADAEREAIAIIVRLAEEPEEVALMKQREWNTEWNPRRIVELGVAETEDGLLDVRGLARDASDVSELRRRIATSGQFADVVLRNGNTTKDPRVISFRLTMRCTGTRVCGAERVQRIWEAQLEANPNPPARKYAKPPASTLKIVGILTKGVRSAVLVDASGFGWIVREGDVMGGDKVVQIRPDRVIYELADGTRRTVKLYP